MNPEPEFYVGYLPAAPPGIARRMRKTVAALATLGGVLALLLAGFQAPFAKARFEFGQPHEWSGWLVTAPYPRLLVPRPGADSYSSYLLVGPGKFGADRLVQGFDRQWVRGVGTFLYRDGQTLVEVAEAPLGPAPPLRGLRFPSLEAEDRGVATLDGEIVDSKCWGGVMNPGQGKVHRACAIRCLSGGIPPALATRDSSGQPVFVLIADAEGGAAGRALAPYAGEPVAIAGRLRREGDSLWLEWDRRPPRRWTER